MEIKDTKQAKQILQKAERTQEQLRALMDYVLNLIEQSGYKKSYLAQRLNLTPSAFSLRLKNRSFTIEQLKQLIEILEK